MPGGKKGMNMEGSRYERPRWGISGRWTCSVSGYINVGIQIVIIYYSLPDVIFRWNGVKCTWISVLYHISTCESTIMSKYRHSLLYCISLHGTLRILHFQYQGKTFHQQIDYDLMKVWMIINIQVYVYTILYVCM